MWKDERLEPAFPPMNLEAATAVMQMHRERIGELVGSSAVFGQSQPGVTTGYHDALQIDQNEHLDSRIEQNICTGAEDATRLMYAHVAAMNEKLQLFDVRLDKKGNSYGDYVPLDPKWLTPFPQVNAKVKSDRPTNYMQNMQVFLQATADRAGPGTPAVPDDWGREKLLGITNPDEMQQMVDAQTARRTAMSSGVVGDLILQRLKMKQIAAGTPNVSAATATQADPSLQQAIQGMNGPGGEAQQTGGVAPNTLTAEMQGRAAAGVPPQLSQPQSQPPAPGVPHGIQGVGGGNAPGNAQMPEVMANTQRLMQGH